MRKLIYVSPDGLETGSWETAKTWESYTIRLDEIHEPHKKWHNPKLKEENAKRGIYYD